MKLSEQCKTCKANWDGHCINGNDSWKSRMGDKEVKCEDYKESEGEGDFTGYILKYRFF